MTLAIVSHGNMLRIFQRPALEAQKVVVSANPTAWEFPTDPGPNLIHGTISRFAVQEPADSAKGVVLLVPKHSLPGFRSSFRKRPPCLLNRHTNMLRQATYVPLAYDDVRIGAAVRGAAMAVIGNRQPLIQ